MIKLNTVFIIGAGASKPYGFPLGEELFELICDNIRKGRQQFRQLVDIGFHPKHIKDFGDSLFTSGTTSVDQFLEHRTEFIEIGKCAISQALIPRENNEHLFSVKAEHNWLKYIFGVMNASFEEVDQNKVSFITFNYDRIIEHFFFTSLKNLYKRNDNEVANKVRNISIIHLHGELGKLPWQDGASFREFTPTISDDAIRIAAKNVKIIHEPVDDDEEFKTAHELMAKAERVFFLGFGFHPTNLKRLKLGDKSGRQIAGTAKNLTEFEKQTIRLAAKSINPDHLHDVDIITFFRNHFQLA